MRQLSPTPSPFQESAEVGGLITLRTILSLSLFSTTVYLSENHRYSTTSITDDFTGTTQKSG